MWHICNLIISSSIVLLPIISRIGFGLHVNESISRDIIYKLLPKYVVDRENYLYLHLMCAEASLCIGGTATLAIGLTIFTYLKHVCGMLKIAR